MKKKVLYVLCAMILLSVVGILDYMGFIWHNNIFAMWYQVKGLDVSHYQHTIDWKLLQKENDFQFVYIKATEGKDLVDHKFSYNWQEARKNGFYTGAYHFFSMKSPGVEQAKNFMQTVPKEANALPPVIDIEIHLYHKPEKARQELTILSDMLEKHYGKRPILYVTYDTYHKYIQGHFKQHRIWIRDILKYPTLDDREWLLWQYSNRGRVEGISTYVDINVLNGSMEDLTSPH